MNALVVKAGVGHSVVRWRTLVAKKQLQTDQQISSQIRKYPRKAIILTLV